MTREHEGRSTTGRSTRGEAWTPPAGNVGKRSLTEGIAYGDQPPAVPAPARPDIARRLVEGAGTSAAVTREPAPVQRTASGLPFLQLKGTAKVPPSTESIHAAAERGAATPATPLPHGDAIQRAFGHHDISGVKAHAGSDASAAAGELGAAAYATGNHVVFAGAPDLHTAAHEAAHVVQQRGGVQLKGGVGAAGDEHERHADAVAELVVHGKSAESLLDEHRGTAGAAAVQRKISFDQPQIAYGPADREWRALLDALEAHHVSLDDKQTEALNRLFSDGEHHFTSLDALLEDHFGMVGGLQPSQPRGLSGRVSQTEQSGEWFVSDGTRGLEDIAPDFAKQDAPKQLKLQLAACGGEIYRALLEGRQPKVLTGNCDAKPVRASQAVPGLMAWPVHSGQTDKAGSGYTMLGSGKAVGATEGTEVSISGLLSVYVTAMFLGDVDLNLDNLSAVLEAQTLHAVKIDPEASFSGFFFHGPDELRPALANPTLAQPHQVNHTFADNLCRALAADDMSIIALLHSSDAIREKYTIIKRILDFGADRLIAIVNRCISDQFADVKGLLRHGLVARIDSLQQAAMGLPGYPEFASGTELSPAVGLPDELMTTTMRQDIDEDEDQDDEEGEDGGFLGNMALPQAPMTTGMSRDVEQRDDADEEEADEEANEKHHHSSSSESDENDAAKPAKKKRKGR